jgi:peptidase MA superfamily protein
VNRRAPSRTVLAGAAAAFALFAAVAGPAATTVHAADPVFGKPTIDARFDQGVELTQPVTLDETPKRVEVLITFADASGPLVVELPPPSSIGATTLRHQLSAASDGHIVPNTPIKAQWRITAEDGSAVTGPVVDTVFDDDRFTWRTIRGDIVRLHWYEGTDAFADRALQIGETAIKETADLLGVTEDKPVDFYIYADTTAFLEAMGPGTAESVVGQAHADIRTMFALIPPGDINDPEIARVVPHELVHLVFDTAAHNSYHFPPRWLNEGLAVYLSEGYAPDYRSMVEAAARDGTLVPLDGLAGDFPAGDKVFLAYGEGVSAVDFFIRSHDQDALVKLIRSYADGKTDDEAFESAIGMTTAEFNDAWMAELDAVKPERFGPQPAPPGPRPAAWAGPGGASATTPPAQPGQVATPRPGVEGGTIQLIRGDATLALLVVALIVFAAAGGLAWSRARRGRPPAGPAGP